jgi:hypothetical protein
MTAPWKSGKWYCSPVTCVLRDLGERGPYGDPDDDHGGDGQGGAEGSEGHVALVADEGHHDEGDLEAFQQDPFERQGEGVPVSMPGRAPARRHPGVLEIRPVRPIRSARPSRRGRPAAARHQGHVADGVLRPGHRRAGSCSPCSPPRPSTNNAAASSRTASRLARAASVRPHLACRVSAGHHRPQACRPIR